MSPLLLLLTALPSGSYGYTLELKGAPAAQVELEVKDDALVYRRTFFFRRGPQHDEARFPRPDKPLLASFYLLALPKMGCVDARDESSPKKGKVCVTKINSDGVEGTLFGQKFKATYGDDQLLRTLELPTGRYLRGRAYEGKDAFEEGFEVQGEGELHVFPEVPGALTRPVASLKGVKLSGNCLERAEALVAQSKGKYELVLGVVEDGGKMWPHAWVVETETRLSFDPTLPNAEKREYLQLPLNEAGQLYLELLQGLRKLVRGVRAQ